MYVTGSLLPPDPAVLSHFLFLGQPRSRWVSLTQGSGGDRNSQGHAGSQASESLAETLDEVYELPRIQTNTLGDAGAGS